MPTESASAVAYRRLTRTRDPGAEIAALAERQYGVISRLQLRQIGLRESAIDRRRRAGRLHLLHKGVYTVGHRLIPREGRWMAAVLASGPDAVLSHWSAAHLWMIRPNTRTRIDVTVAHRSRSSKPIRRHISAVPEDERTVEEGIPVTTVPRTILDLAATEDSDTVENLLRESEFRQLSDRLSLPDLITRYELDGWDGHSTRTAFREDRARGRRLTAAGYTVTHITWNQLDEEPEAIASDLGVLLQRGSQYKRP